MDADGFDAEQVILKSSEQIRVDDAIRSLETARDGLRRLAVWIASPDRDCGSVQSVRDVSIPLLSEISSLIGKSVEQIMEGRV